MEPLNFITRLNHEVKSFECGPDSKLKITNLFLLFQEAAYVSAENLGFGYHSLQSKNMTWVLSSLKVQFLDFPKWSDKIELLTWPSGHNRLVGFREFKVEGVNEKPLMNATSEWLAIDLDSRRPLNINDFEIELPDQGEKALDEKLSRLNPKRYGEGEEIYQVTVPYSAIDENGHVNNAEYVKWALDGMRSSNNDIEGIASLQVSFISELFENDKCKIFFRKKDKELLHLWGQNEKTNEFVFAIEILQNQMINR